MVRVERRQVIELAKLAFVVGALWVLASLALDALDKPSSLFSSEGRSVSFEFADGPTPAFTGDVELPAGDLVLTTGLLDVSGSVPPGGTWAIPLSGREAGGPVRVLDSEIVELSPGGKYAVVERQIDGEIRDFVRDFVRLSDRQVVGTMNSVDFVFVGDHRIIAFGSADNSRFGKVKSIDLRARTVDDLDIDGVKGEISASYVIDGDVRVCEWMVRGLSGPSCDGRWILDPSSGEIRAAPAATPEGVTDHGRYVDTVTWGGQSWRVGDEVAYVIEGRDMGDGREPDRLLVGPLSGPTATDRRAESEFGEVGAVSATSDDERILVLAETPIGDQDISVCDVATLDCTALGLAGEEPDSTWDLSMVGVVPASSLGG